MYILFFSVNGKDFCIRKKVGTRWNLVYGSDDFWSQSIPDKYIQRYSEKQKITDQNEIKKFMIGLL
jgi:hypothetical protein